MIPNARSRLNVSEYAKTIVGTKIEEAKRLAKKEGRHRLVMSDISLYEPIIKEYGVVDEDDLFLFSIASPRGRGYINFGQIQSAVLNMLYGGAKEGPGNLLFDLGRDRPLFYGFYSSGRKSIVSNLGLCLSRLSGRGLIERKPSTDTEPVEYYMTPEQKARVL